MSDYKVICSCVSDWSECKTCPHGIPHEPVEESDGVYCDESYEDCSPLVDELVICVPV